MDIEFTDRYGGRAPSLLRGCYRCDAMGCYPEPPAGARMADGTINLDAFTSDDWEFVTCPECHGTARVSWFATIKRIPRWLLKGMRFAWEQRAGHGFWQGHIDTSRGQQMKIALWAAFGAELGLPMPRRKP